jgi:hypothetical protein
MMYRSRNGGNGELEIILSHCLLGYIAYGKQIR